ncbi:MAG: hypothetical protein EZS28_030774, partial [Streblomastix strix]
MVNNPGLFGSQEGPLDLLTIMQKNELNVQIDPEFIDIFVEKCLNDQKDNKEPALHNIFFPIFIKIQETVENTSFPEYPDEALRVLVQLTYNKNLMALFSIEPGLLFNPFPAGSPYSTQKLNPLAKTSTSDGVLHFSKDMSVNPPTLFLSLLSRSTLGRENNFFAPMHLFFDKSELLATASKELIDCSGNFQFTSEAVRRIAKQFSDQRLFESNMSLSSEIKEIIQRVKNTALNVNKLHEHINQLMYNTFRVNQPPADLCFTGLTSQQQQYIQQTKPISQQQQLQQQKEGSFQFDSTISLAQNMINFLECFCLHNDERTKLNCDEQISSADGFVLSLCGALLSICEPFSKIPQIDQKLMDEVVENSSIRRKDDKLSKTKQQQHQQQEQKKLDVKDLNIYLFGIRDNWISKSNNIQRAPTKEIIYGRTNQNWNKRQVLNQTKPVKQNINSSINQQQNFEISKWRGLLGATEAELKCNQHLNKIQLHFAKYSTTHSLSQIEPKISLNSRIQLVEPNLKELIAQKTQQDINQPFKFQRASEYLYLTIHALHVGLIPALNKYRKLLVAREEQFERLSPKLEQLTVSPFPSVMTHQVAFEDFIKFICEEVEIQHSKKLAHQLMINENKQPTSQEIQSLLTKPLISSQFKYEQAITGIYTDAVHHLHPSFREETHEQVLRTLAQIRDAKLLLEQSYG